MQLSKYKSRKIKVANILEEGKVGGPAHRVVRVSEALPENINTIILMPKANSAEFVKLCEQSNIKFQKLNISGLSKDTTALLKYLFLSPIETLKLYNYLKKESFDIVHVSGGSWMVKGVIAGYLAKTKVIWHINDTNMPKLIRIIFSKIAPLATSFVFASERSKAYYQPLIHDNKPWDLIPSLVDMKRFDPSISFPIKHSIPNWENKIIVGIVGNISPVKGIETFIKAAIQTGNPNEFKFIIIGNIFKSQINYYNEMLKLIPNNYQELIEFIGGVTDVRPYLSKIDIYVCSSNYESSPIAVWEAMAMEKAIISTDVGDVPLYIDNDKNGIVVPTSDYKAIADNILKLSKDESKRKSFGKLARKTIEKHLSLELCVERHISTYNKIYDLKN